MASARLLKPWRQRQVGSCLCLISRSITL